MNAIGIVTNDQRLCHHCYSHLPPQRYNEVMRNDSLILCSSCGSILIWAQEEFISQTLKEPEIMEENTSSDGPAENAAGDSHEENADPAEDGDTGNAGEDNADSDYTEEESI
ncbi:MAG: C4-type zinc ribbon domain-containing protein [bacterium]